MVALKIIAFLLIYVIGYFVSILALKKYGSVLEMDHYDPPHDGWDDDYVSNAQAYMSFSIMWPFFWLATSIFGFFKWLQRLTKKILDS